MQLSAVLAIAALSLASLYAAKAGISDIELKIAQDSLDTWSHGMHVPGVREWERIKGHLWRAYRLNPANPDVLSELGRLYEIRAVDESLSRNQVLGNWAAALSYYRRASVWRPTWPHTWASIATVKLKLLQLDHEFLMALDKASKLGPWEPSVQVRVVELGFAAWVVLPDKARAAVLATAERALNRHGREIVRLAQKYDRDCDIYYLLIRDEQLRDMSIELPDCRHC